MAIKSAGSKKSNQGATTTTSRGRQAGRNASTSSTKPQAPKASSDNVSVSREAQSPSSASESSRLPDLASGFAELADGPESASAATATSVADAPAETTSPSLELGQGQLLSRGRGQAEQISQLQEMLNAGGSSLEVDGKFGPLTDQAVRNFQRERGLTVDGIVGPQTMAALNSGGESSAPGQDSAGVDGQPAGENAEATSPEASESPTSPGATTDSAQPNGEIPAGRSTTTLQGIPERPEGARGGREFMEELGQLRQGPEREQAILREILSGNIPDSSRELQELVVERGGREIRMHAMADYLAVGSNEDNVRVPMTPAVAQAIADRTGTKLPTDRIVDDIHGQAQQLHMPTFSSNRESVGTFLSHDQRIDEQLGSGQAPGSFVSGHKKDLVIPRRDGRVAIYGGRWADGSRIQPYSNVHGEDYVDYSHGARLVSQQITVDGRSMTLEAALTDPSLRGLFTNQ